MKTLAVLLLSVALSACVSHREDAPWHEGWEVPYMGKVATTYTDYATMIKQWQGQSLKSLVQSWGQPTRMQYGLDGRLRLQYVTMRLSSLCQQDSIEPSYGARYQGVGNCQQTQLVNCRTEFTIDDSGAYTQDSAQKIINASYQGPYCGL